MKKTKILSFISIGMILTACGNNETENEENMEFDNNAAYTENENTDGEQEEEPIELEEENDNNYFHEEDDMEEETQENEEGSGNSTYDAGVADLELEIILADGTEIYYDYEVMDADAEGEVEVEDNAEDLELEGSEGVNEIEEMLQNVEITPESSEEEAAAQIYSFLGIDEEEVEEFELEIEFADGEQWEADR